MSQAGPMSVEAARGVILADLAPVATEMVAIHVAAGRVLARDVAARLDHPAADVSAMDGYALAADIAPGERRAVVGTSRAGHPHAGPIGTGEALRVFTGSVLPAGADRVLLQEDANRDGTDLIAQAPVARGRHVRTRGSDFAAGSVLLAAGQRLGARSIGLAAGADHAWLEVRRRPRVALLATGDEVALPGEPRPPGGLASSNSLALAALIGSAGAEAVLLPVAADDLEAIRRGGEAALGCELLVTIGGASVGDHDLVRPGLAPLGFAPDVWKIAMRPGKPLMHGHLTAGGRRLAVLGLPGNPVSALVCGCLFLIPAIARLLGLPGTMPNPRRARLGAPLPANDARADHIRARLEETASGTVATPYPIQDSSRLFDLARADALVLRAPHAAAAALGDAVEILDLPALGL